VGGGSGHAGFEVTTGSTTLGELDAYFGCDAREEPLGVRGLSRGGPPVSRPVAQCAQDEATPEPSALELCIDRDAVDVAGAAVVTYLPDQAADIYGFVVVHVEVSMTRRLARRVIDKPHRLAAGEQSGVEPTASRHSFGE
jgi:hypothetical protein